MASLLHRIHPAYRTSRGDYWPACAGYCAFILVIAAVVILAGDEPGAALGSAVTLLSLLVTGALVGVTIRRLRDAAVSIWWVLLFFIPLIFSWHMPQVTVQMPDISSLAQAHVSFDFMDFRSMIAFIPILIGLLKGTAPTKGQMI